MIYMRCSRKFFTTIKTMLLLKLFVKNISIYVEILPLRNCKLQFINQSNQYVIIIYLFQKLCPRIIIQLLQFHFVLHHKLIRYRMKNQIILFQIKSIYESFKIFIQSTYHILFTIFLHFSCNNFL